jgi:hypothetical protein
LGERGNDPISEFYNPTGLSCVTPPEGILDQKRFSGF